MTSWAEGNHSFYIGDRVSLINDDREIAADWASPYILHNPAYRYVMGRFVEADQANNNRQLFSLHGLQVARPTITHAPMNMSHDTRRVVGAFIASELMYPIGTQKAAEDRMCPACGSPVPQEVDDCPNCGQTMSDGTKMMGDAAKADAASSDAGLNPYIEALGVFWVHYFPEEYSLVKAAHAQNRLFFSMECVPAQIQCVGDGGCGAQFEYAGRTSPAYCDHLNKGTSDKYLIEPHFTAGALLVPPVQPGWSRADVRQLVAHHAEATDRLYESIAASAADLNKNDWEAAMAELLVLASR